MILQRKGRRYSALAIAQMLLLQNSGALPVRFCLAPTTGAIGAGNNVMANLLQLDRKHETGTLTRLVNDAHGQRIFEDMRSMGVAVTPNLLSFSNERTHQSATMSFGFPIGDRGQEPIVRRWCDAMANLTAEVAWANWDVDELMKSTAVFHMCMHELGLNPQMPKIYGRLCDKAREHGAVVMVNLNYRASIFDPADLSRMRYWRSLCRKFAKKADILVGSESKALSDLKLRSVNGEAAVETVGRAYPNAKLVVLTNRDATQARYSNSAFSAGELTKVSPRSCQVVWPIGSGDAHDAGVLHGLFEGWSIQETLSFASDCAIDNLATVGDLLRASAEEIQKRTPKNKRT